MLFTHANVSPRVDPAAWIAPNAVVCGDVTVGPGCRIQYGAQLVAEGGSIALGRECIVMENAVLRSSGLHALSLGDHCLVGPGAHVVGSTVEDEVFLATGCVVLHGSFIGARSEVRVHGVVHVASRLPSDTTVPIGWVAVGDPAEVLPPDEHDRIWALQEPLDFPGRVYGLPRAEATMPRITRRLSETLAEHMDDEPAT